MAIFKSAENMTVTVSNTDIVACETYSEVAEQVIIETINGDLTLNSADMITLQGGIPDTYTENNLTDSANDNKPSILDAYFIKWNTDTGEKSLDKITERGLSYQVAVVVETRNLSGKKIKLKIKSAQRKVLSDIDTEIGFIDMKDIDAVTVAANYKNVTSKNEFEAEVDNLFKSTSISNKDDFKDKAVFRLMLNSKPNDLSFDWAKLIMADEDKKALVYIEVECAEPEVVYNGQGENKNTFLNEEGQYFEIKYLEQPWIIKAREEQESGINETNNCTKIINDYHQTNREYKPSGCKGIAGAWCASFVGWCLKETSYSAQRDAGAYSYEHINTRYREKSVMKKGVKVVTAKEKFDTPIWGQTTNSNKNALGAICVIGSRKHVTFAVAKSKTGSHYFGLGGNQGDSVKVSPYSTRSSSIFPKYKFTGEYEDYENTEDYTIKDKDYELPVYYRELTAESTT